jgi:hypothetical protein
MFNLKEIYSISLCFGKRDHLDIMGPIIVPYLERKEDSSQEESEKLFNQRKFSLFLQDLLDNIS